MKKLIPIFVVSIAVILFFNGKKYDELVSSRLSSSIAICLEGESCGQATAMAVAAEGGARSAESIYVSGCAACHDAGVAGAPMMGNKSQWELVNLRVTKCLLIMPIMELMACLQRVFAQTVPKKR